MIAGVARHINRLVSPVSKVLSYVSAVVMALTVLLVVVNVCMRRFANSPILGVHDISALAFSIIVFLPMAWCALKDGHVSFNIVVDRFPRTTRLAVEAIMLLITTGILGLVSWQLVMQGIRLGSMNAETALLEIPLSPFLYLAALGMTMMTMAFLIKFLQLLSAIGKPRK